MEDSLVVVFLEESLLTALLLLARFFGSLRILLDAQFFRQRAARLDFLANLFEPVHRGPRQEKGSATGEERLNKRIRRQRRTAGRTRSGLLGLV